MAIHGPCMWKVTEAPPGIVRRGLLGLGLNLSCFLCFGQVTQVAHISLGASTRVLCRAPGHHAAGYILVLLYTPPKTYMSVLKGQFVFICVELPAPSCDLLEPKPFVLHH